MSIDRYRYRNIPAKEFKKLSKYKDLEIKIAKMWKMKTKTIPVIVGTLVMIKKGTQKYVNEIPGNLFLPVIQTVLLTFLEELFHYNETITFGLYIFICMFLCLYVYMYIYIYIYNNNDNDSNDNNDTILLLVQIRLKKKSFILRK